MKGSRPDASYMPQLDSLRAVAVLAVMINHWLPDFLGFHPWGDLGVRCFFVLSGFLITGILLRARSEIDGGRSTRWRQFRQFYVRRCLRIFPIYYLTLVVAVIVGVQVARDSFSWHFFYASNFYFAQRNDWNGSVSHLWSLSVEEQFYLLWPALVFLAPRKALPALFAAGIVAAAAARLGMAAWLGPQNVSVHVLLPCCLDQLMTGALLALLISPEGAKWASNTTLRKFWPAIPLLMAVELCAENAFADSGGAGASWTLAVLGPTVQALFFAALVGACARGVPGVTGRIVGNPALRYLGRISYGLYLYHLFVEYAVKHLEPYLARHGFRMPDERAARFFILFVITLAVASLSARFVERYFNNLKRFFPSEEPAPAPPQPIRVGPVSDR